MNKAAAAIPFAKNADMSRMVLHLGDMVGRWAWRRDEGRLDDS